jgi:hypothetical protein
MRGATSLVFLSCLVFVGVATAQDTNPTPSDTKTVSVRLKGGSTLEATRVQRTAGLVYITLSDGRVLAFSPDDVVWSDATERASVGLLGTQQTVTESAPAGALTEIARSLHLTENSIELTGDPAALNSSLTGELPQKSRFEEEHDTALEQLTAAASAHSNLAAETSTNIAKYLNACTGSTVTYNSGTTTGVGRSGGTGVAAFVGGGDWGRFAGVTGFSWQGWSSWQEQHEWRSETPNDETPFCRALASDVGAAVWTLRPILLPQITTARLAGVLQMEVDQVLVSYGYGPSQFWLED